MPDRHRGQDNFVTGRYELAAVAVHHQIDGIGGAAGEDGGGAGVKK